MATITSANSIFTLTAAAVFPVPQTLQGYAADDAFANDALDISEVMMGVDGKLSAGYVPNPTNINISLQADSPSIAIFEAIIAGMKVTRNTIYLSGTISLPSTGKTYTLTRGVLKSASQLPDAKKVLQPQKYTLVFESVTTTTTNPLV